MPVEIKELVIRAVVEREPSELQRERMDRTAVEAQKEAIIQACVQQVLRILKKTEER